MIVIQSIDDDYTLVMTVLHFTRNKMEIIVAKDT